MKIGLFFGSFNPIHVGHLAIANYILEFTDLEQVWFIVSPHNPLKEKKTLLADYHRYELVYRAIDDFPLFKVSNIEFSLPKPSYTIDTLTYLLEKYPQHQFVVIVGADSMQTFHKWKNYEVLLKEFEIFVYPRPDCNENKYSEYKNIRFISAPLFDISSSFIRQAIKDGKNMQFFVPKPVWNYIDEMNFYR